VAPRRRGGEHGVLSCAMGARPQAVSVGLARACGGREGRGGKECAPSAGRGGGRRAGAPTVHELAPLGGPLRHRREGAAGRGQGDTRVAVLYGGRRVWAARLGQPGVKVLAHSAVLTTAQHGTLRDCEKAGARLSPNHGWQARRGWPSAPPPSIKPAQDARPPPPAPSRARSAHRGGAAAAPRVLLPDGPELPQRPQAVPRGRERGRHKGAHGDEGGGGAAGRADRPECGAGVAWGPGWEGGGWVGGGGQFWPRAWRALGRAAAAGGSGGRRRQGQRRRPSFKGEAKRCQLRSQALGRQAARPQPAARAAASPHLRWPHRCSCAFPLAQKRH
jgi:hypothetical protein